LAGLKWRVRRGSSVNRFSHGLVIQGRRPGMLDLSVCILTSGGSLFSSQESRRVQPSYGSGRGDYWDSGGDDTGEIGDWDAPRMALSSPPAGLSLLGPLAAACTSEGIRKDTGIISWLYWPNLVTIDEGVVAVTSVSTSATPPSKGGQMKEPYGTMIVFNISVNCFAENRGLKPSASLFSSPFSPPAGSGLSPTSISAVLGVEIDIDLLRDKILHAIDWYHAEWARGMQATLVERIQPTIPWLGRRVVVTMRARTAAAAAAAAAVAAGGEAEVPSGRRVLRGWAAGLDATCSLVLSTGGSRARPREGRQQKKHLPAPSIAVVAPCDVEHVRVAD
jgi:hypothetical protein